MTSLPILREQTGFVDETVNDFKHGAESRPCISFWHPREDADAERLISAPILPMELAIRARRTGPLALSARLAFLDQVVGEQSTKLCELRSHGKHFVAGYPVPLRKLPASPL